MPSKPKTLWERVNCFHTVDEAVDYVGILQAVMADTPERWDGWTIEAIGPLPQRVASRTRASARPLWIVGLRPTGAPQVQVTSLQCLDVSSLPLPGLLRLLADTEGHTHGPDCPNPSHKTDTDQADVEIALPVLLRSRTEGTPRAGTHPHPN